MPNYSVKTHCQSTYTVNRIVKGMSIFSLCRFTVRLPGDDDSDNESMVTESGEEGSEIEFTDELDEEDIL